MPDNITFSYVKFVRGTPTAFANLPVEQRSRDTLYFIAGATDATGELWLGNTLIAKGATEGTVSTFLKDLQDVDLTGAQNGYVLGYDANSSKWVPMDLSAAFTVSEMVGATDSSDGAAGLVPAPKAGEEGYFLRGDGSWAAIEIKDSLSRKIVADLDEAQEYVANNEDADQYIYMVPIEGATGSNKYDEYIVITTKDAESGEDIRSLELVGDWTVDLSDYATKSEVEVIATTVGNLENSLSNYTTLEQVNQAITSATSSLTDTFVTIVDFNAAVGNLDELLAANQSLVSKVDELDNRLKWQDISE